MCEELTTNAELPERTVHFDDKNDDLEIMWLQEKFHGFANIGVTTLPGCRYKEQERNLVKDVEKIVQQKVTDVFCLVTTSEMQKFRVKHLLQMYQKYSLRVHHHPCEDGGLFPVPELIAIIDKLYHIIEDEGNPLLHCVAGKGRSCLVLAAYLIAWHRPPLSSMKAIETVQMFRMCSAFSVKLF
ncbi:cyclin-dependent kinase inhibitor 3-like isoform X2 [Pomacea canaliculata]|uniref:cyclin-dependent kinase inhibitor 3-like isoform X2 n=1 Tax=Pomacea canaliculata TaxID=400727 RepID=UPI000D7302FE|nr:cyclin-dependent kinase inhibitor 3-like isoform X2 [Pomacea canaliculata]